MECDTDRYNHDEHTSFDDDKNDVYIFKRLSSAEHWITLSLLIFYDRCF